MNRRSFLKLLSGAAAIAVAPTLPAIPKPHTFDYDEFMERLGAATDIPVSRLKGESDRFMQINRTGTKVDSIELACWEDTTPDEIINDINKLMLEAL